MKKTILTCDRCRKEVDHLENVGAGRRDHSYVTNIERVWQVPAEWCIPCCIEVGFAKEDPEIPAKPIVPFPTLEEIIREMVREEIQNKQGVKDVKNMR